MFIHTYTFQDMHITKVGCLDTLPVIESLKYVTGIWLTSP